MPYNRQILSEVDFLPAYVSNRPLDSHQMTESGPAEIPAASDQPNREPSSCKAISREERHALPETGENENVTGSLPMPSTSTWPNPTGKTPEEVRPFGKAGPRKKQNCRKCESKVLTDTPIKAALADKKSHSLSKKLNKSRTKGGTSNAVRNLQMCRNKKPPRKESVGFKERCRKELSQAHPTEVTNKKMHHRPKCVRPRPEAERPPLPRRPTWLAPLADNGTRKSGRISGFISINLHVGLLIGVVYTICSSVTLAWHHNWLSLLNNL